MSKTAIGPDPKLIIYKDTYYDIIYILYKYNACFIKAQQVKGLNNNYTPTIKLI